jgi:hypothetical protein
MELSELVGTRRFTATLESNGVVVVREGHEELGRMTLCDALAALTKERSDDDDILDVTIGDTLRAMLRDYGRVV